MRARQILQISGLLLLCLFLLSACDGCGPLDTLRVDSPLDESEITLPIQRVMASLPVPPPTSGRNRRRGIYIRL